MTAERCGRWADSQRPRGTEKKKRRRQVKGEEGRSQVSQKDAAVNNNISESQYTVCGKS